jgi:hypothetical protein
VATYSTPYHYKLYIADFNLKRIFNTCFSTYYGLAISPDSRLLALNASSDLSGPILVLDLNTWSLYSVANQKGDIIGWRS